VSPRIIIRPPAQKDVDRHADYIGERSRSAGHRFYDAVQQAVQQLGAMPELGGRCEFSHPRLSGLRMWSIRGFEKYLIFYLPTDQGIAVVRVLHGARDIESILEQEEDSEG
jgi:toxin ParE1/3/4